MEKNVRTVEERIAEIRQMMELVSELEAARKKYGKTLKGCDTVNVTLPLDDLEIEVYGSFANAVEARLRRLDADRTAPAPDDFDFDKRLDDLAQTVENLSPTDSESLQRADAAMKRIVENLKRTRALQKRRGVQ